MTPADRSGTVLGDYRVDELLGRGGMGEVYRAFDLRRRRVVALKVLPPELASDAAFRDRFVRESRIVASLGDPHIVPIHDWGETDGTLFIDMRLVDGESLGDRLRRGVVAPADAIDVVSQVAGALDHAHEAGLVHRDVKPDNILLDRNGFAYLVDFGIARSDSDTRLTQTGAMIGSIAYMAPERFDRGATGPSVDQYSLACVLVECLTGRPPYGSGEIAVTMRGHLFDAPPMTGTGVDPAVARGLAKEPGHRFPTCRAFAAAARTGLGRPAVSSPGPVPVTAPIASPPRVSPPPRRGRTGVVALCVAGAVLAASIGVGGYLLSRGSDGSRGSTTAQSGTSEIDGPTTACTYPAASTRAIHTVPTPDARQPTSGTPTLHLTTSEGDIDVRLDRSSAPCNVAAVIAVSRAGGVYDMQGCGRSSDYILVCAAGGAGPTTPDIQADVEGPGWTSPNELPTDLPVAAGKVDGLGRQQVTYPRGAVLITNPGAQAARDVAAGSSSFFFVIKPIITAPLYSMIGEVVSGMSVVDDAVRSGFQPAFPGAYFGMPNTMPNLLGSSVS
ncbi:hypothetical protein nbrc107696_36550 [Gordonia spumicola]|uniref:non-specific serine/threonine protein kinase n=1 Tax=Gordonia spumicola TaxID=589161 RepID=A0A7I9VCX8_9ACTN|nr:serine/threonine-protein kinase [Gordonia spumicola]GEE03209.1 hypothetical protein nbrc107696_36550 [Gordonia spumicola]